jgi:hypothetical protein
MLSRYAIQQRSFTSARSAHDTGYLAKRNFQIEIIEYNFIAVSES